MFVPRASPVYRPLARSPSRGGGAIRTVTTPIVVGPLAQRMDVVREQPRMPASTSAQRLVHRPVQRVDRRRCPRRMPPTCSPAARTTAPRLWTLEPEVTVQRARWTWRRRRWWSARGLIGRLGHGGAVAATASPAGCTVRGREVALVAPAELRPGLPDRVLERVGERLRRGRDDVRVAAHRGPRSRAILRVDDDARPGRGRGVAVEDAHLVVDEVDGVELRVERPQRLAQRAVERIDRAVAVGRGVEHLAVHLDLDGRLGEELAAGPLLDEHGVVEDPERRARSRRRGAG